MPVVNRAPFNEIPRKWAFDPEIEPFVRKLLDIIWQLRNRSGGDADYVLEIQGDYVESEATFNYDIRELKADRDKLKAEIATEKRKNRDLLLMIGEIKAQIATIGRHQTKLNAKLESLISEVQTNA